MGKRLKRAFFVGFGSLMPTMLTILVIYYVYTFVTEKIVNPLNLLIREILAGTSFEWMYLDFFGYVIVLMIVFLVGLFVTSFFGKKIFRILERKFANLPIINTVYPHAKQITEFLFGSDDPDKFSSVVAIEYPRKGIYCLGFVTSRGMKQVVQEMGSDILTVFIPTSPAPFTGFVVFVKKEETIALTITIEEAIRFCVSAGVIIPPSQLIGMAENKIVTQQKEESDE